MTYKALPAKQSYFSRILEITVRAGDFSSTATRRPSCNDTGQHGYTNFPTERQVTIRCPNGNSWKVYKEVLSEAGIITMLPSAPSRPTSFEHCQNSTGVPTRCWTPLPCIYQRCHQCWRVTRYHDYATLPRIRTQHHKTSARQSQYPVT